MRKQHDHHWEILSQLRKHLLPDRGPGPVGHKSEALGVDLGLCSEHPAHHLEETHDKCTFTTMKSPLALFFSGNGHNGESVL